MSARARQTMMRKRPIVEALEPRRLYSADSAALAAAVLGPPAAEHRLVESAAHEVAFIDARVPDTALLVQDIAAQSGRQVDVVMLDAEREALEQVTEALAGRENVAALHIIAHDRYSITLDQLERDPSQAEAWRSALTADADILLYGCDIAATAEGRLLVDALARLTGADVSASDDATGHAALGGDWQLEYATGAIEAQVALSQNAQQAWAHLLDTILVSYEPPFADMPDNFYEVTGSTPRGQSFSFSSGTGTYVVDKIELVLYKNLAAGGGNVQVQLRDAFNGNVLGNGNIARAALGTVEAYATITLSAPVALNDNQTYVIRVHSGPGDVFVGVDDTGTYAGGTFINDGVVEAGKDMAFRLINAGAPVVAGAGATLGYTEGDTATVIDATLTISDVDDANIDSATVTINAGLVSAEDVLAFTPAFGITGSYVAATGTLTLSGSATLAQYESVLGSVTYQNTNTGNPGTGARTVSWVVNDGNLDSAATTSTITVAAVNDAPVNAVPGAQSTNEDTALVFSAGNGNAISIADDAGASPVQVVLTGSNGAITLAGLAGLTFSAGDGTADAAMTFSGSLGAINAALNGLSFAPGAEFSGAASLSISADDQGNTGAGGPLSDADAVAITVNVVNDVPTVTLSGGTTTFTQGSGAVLVDGALGVGDVDNATLASATVSIGGGFLAAEDLLGFSSNPATMGNIAGSYSAASGVLSLSSAGATATLAQWQAALRAVTYDNTNPVTSGGVRSVSFDVSDGTSYGPAVAQTVSVQPGSPTPSPLPPPVVPPIPPVVVLPPPVSPPPPATPGPQQTPTVSPGRVAAAGEFSEEGVGVPVFAAGADGTAVQTGAGQHFNPLAAGFRPVGLGTATSVPGVEAAEGDLLPAVLRQLEARQLDLFPADGLRRAADVEGLGNDLARLRDGLRQEEQIQTRTVVTLAAGSLSMTLAYLLWLVRGGALAASMLSALPAWRLLDPLPILARVDDGEEESDEEDDRAVAPFAEEPEGGTGP